MVYITPSRHFGLINRAVQVSMSYVVSPVCLTRRRCKSAASGGGGSDQAVSQTNAGVGGISGKFPPSSQLNGSHTKRAEGMLYIGSSSVYRQHLFTVHSYYKPLRNNSF